MILPAVFLGDGGIFNSRLRLSSSETAVETGGASFPTDYNLPSEVVGPLATAIGGLVISWGMAETSLNLCVVTIYNHAGGKHGTDEIPVALKRKLDFLRRCFKKIAALEPYRLDGLSLISRAGILGNKRNEIIHGFISEYDPKTEKFTFTGLGSRGANAVIVGQPKFSTHEIIEIGEACMTLGMELAKLASRLVSAFVG